MKYLRSSDWGKKQIGIVAIILMAVSTIVLVWWGIVWTEGYIQSITSGLIPGL
jgi:hypothetical protein